MPRKGNGKGGSHPERSPRHLKTNKGQGSRSSGSNTSESRCHRALGSSCPWNLRLRHLVPGSTSEAILGHPGLQTGLPFPPSPDGGRTRGP